ncbi:hypothetical protein IG193_07290 [Infirmifilum lucidum]|uniref:4-vinyl reductase 4VR domain-containing protein n=1 Tax=Infirmifilum lucidum TaxID=2776706 RepID=A0A7L9FGW1_9CREN|nr:hypothetical protein [Infirmifilum lucidum]QOJ78552.1 hypothetical protein IG193_07290 [Infirmifilum lucidum]
MSREVVLERGIQPLHYFVAKALAAFREEGFLKYAIVKGAMARVGKSLADIYGKPEDPAQAVMFLNGLLGFAGRLEARLDGNTLRVVIDSSTCRICPRVVGGAELTEPLCPMPGLLSGYLGARLNGIGLRKEGQTCIVELEASKTACPA